MTDQMFDAAAEDPCEQPTDIGDLLDAAMGAPVAEITATRHDGGITTASRPQKYTCSDNRLYAVKFKQNNHGDGKAIFNEQVVGALGVLVGAPVAAVALVRVSQAFADALNAVTDAVDFKAEAGVHHGSRWRDKMSGRQQVAYVDENRERFGALDVLYAWAACSGDQQWIYENDAPHAVLSTDHSPFFPGGSSWDTATLTAQQGNVARDPVLEAIELTSQDRQAALERLAAVEAGDVVTAVGRPPAAWGVARTERIALAEYLLARKDAVIALLS
jgi:hypothetical protein